MRTGWRICSMSEPIVLEGSHPDIYVRMVDIEARDGEVWLCDAEDEIDIPMVRTLLAYTPADAVRVAERMLATAREVVVVDERQGRLL